MTAPNPVAAPARNLRELSIRSYSVDEGRCVVVLAGEIDLASAPALKAVLAELSDLEFTQFVLDLSAVAHMDSTGLGVLVGFQNRLGQSARLSLAAVPSNLASLLGMVGLDARIATFPTVEAALAESGGVPQSPAGAIELREAAVGPSGTDVQGAEGAGQRAEVPIGSDAGLVLGLASTALPFAGSELAEAERWLRILRRYGDAGRILRDSGVREAPFADLAANETRKAHGRAASRAEDRLAAVTEQAKRVAADRGVKAVRTVDLLKGVIATYGPDFDRVLAAYGGERTALENPLAIH